MKLALVVGLACVAVLVEGSSIFERNFKNLHRLPPPPPAMSRAEIRVDWIEQKLDNFNEKDDRTWKMRYMSNDQYFKDGGPIFIFVGGEWAISSGYLTGGHMHDMAKEHNGYLFYTEHRYYGKSEPTKNLSNENMQYLHVKQALADLAHFIKTKKAEIPGLKDSKVVLTGGSYSATMVTWFQIMYPELAAGSWASSAPLLAKVDFVEYKEVTGRSILAVGGQACYKRIENGIRELENLFDTNQGATAKALLKLCDNFNAKSKLDVWTLFSEISDIFAGVVQNHNGNTIQTTCKQILSADDDLSGLTNFILSRFGSASKCNDLSYKALIESLGDTSFNPDKMMRQWFYQTCNEYGWYQTSGSKDQPFGTKFPVELYLNVCKDAYGDHFVRVNKISENVDQTNEFFGGLQPNVTNLYITHGALDPWSAMGIQQGENATVIPSHAHCQDFGSISPKDSPQMRASKEKIAELVRLWVKKD